MHAIQTVSKRQIDPRESWRNLPTVCQPFLTWLSGKPLNEPAWRVGIWHHFAAALLPVVAGTALSAWAVQQGWSIAYLPVTWLLAVHGLRKLRTGIMHQCSHGNFTRNRNLDDTLGTIISVILASESYRRYMPSHVHDHHGKGHVTMADPTVQFLILKMGLRGGMAREESWQRLWRTILSPRFYVEAIWGRIVSHFVAGSWIYGCIFLAYHLIFTALFVFVAGWHGWIAGWLLPVWILFSISAVFRLSCRHTFPERDREYHGREAVAGFTDGIFLGEPIPSQRCFLAWAKWSYRMIFIHLVQRLFVLPLDGPCHDWHHRKPCSPAWVKYPYARRDDIEAGHAGWPPYTETWGVPAMIDRVFATLENADPEAYRPETTTQRASLIELSAALHD